MEKMYMYAKKAAKVTGSFCAVTGIIALSSIVISGAAVGAAIGACKYAKDTVNKMLNDNTQADKDTEAQEFDAEKFKAVEAAKEITDDVNNTSETITLEEH